MNGNTESKWTTWLRRLGASTFVIIWLAVLGVLWLWPGRGFDGLPHTWYQPGGLLEPYYLATTFARNAQGGWNKHIEWVVGLNFILTICLTIAWTCLVGVGLLVLRGWRSSPAICGNCGFQALGAPPAICPECGSDAIHVAALPMAVRFALWRAVPLGMLGVVWIVAMVVLWTITFGGTTRGHRALYKQGLFMALDVTKWWRGSGEIDVTPGPGFTLTLVVSIIITAGVWLGYGLVLTKLRYRPTDTCNQCGYDLRGSTGPTCPECGYPKPQPKGD